MSDNRTLLVIGGTGFIGRHVVKQGRNLGYRITVLSLNMPLDGDKFEGVEYLQADICQLEQLTKALRNRCFSYVINLGGYVNHAKLNDGGLTTILSHFLGTQNLVVALNSEKLKSFVQIGSSDEYGGARAPQYESLREDPISPYSVGKVSSTHLLQMLSKTENFPVVILRFFLVYGPGQAMNRFLPQVITGCINKESFASSEGGQLRDFCYIDDVVDAIFLAMRNKVATSEVINVASGIPVSIADVIRRVQKLAGGGEARFGDLPYRTGENMSLYADTSKVKELLSWVPQVDLEKGLMKTIEYYRNELK